MNSPQSAMLTPKHATRISDGQLVSATAALSLVTYLVLGYISVPVAPIAATIIAWRGNRRAATRWTLLVGAVLLTLAAVAILVDTLLRKEFFQTPGN